MNIDVSKLVRKNVLALSPYTSARGEFTGNAKILLDANENAFGSPLAENYHRYPDPMQTGLKEKLADLSGLTATQICIGNGSDELIDLLIRIFCVPAQDEIIVCPPTFRMYDVAAGLNDVAVKRILLTEDFQPNANVILQETTSGTKILFLCSPNNPTGNDLDYDTMQELLSSFPGIIVIDEAYISYSNQPSFLPLVSEHNNLVVLQTLSKAWGLAALRVGIAYANEEIIGLMNRIRMPYNVNGVSQSLASLALNNRSATAAWIAEIKSERARVQEKLPLFSFVIRVYPSAANFLLVKVTDAKALYQHLVSCGIIVRNQSTQPMLANCLRMTIGTPDENNTLLQALNRFES